MNATPAPAVTPEAAPIDILIVEDSPTQALRLQYALERHGFSATVVSNGQDALRAVAQADRPPDVIISDIIMPEMDGFELCRTLRAHPATQGTPLVLLSTLSDPEDIIKGLKCGANNFVTKPFDEDLLVSRIHYLLANRELWAADGEEREPVLDIFFGGRMHSIRSDRRQMIDLLLSTYENAMLQSRRLDQAYEELRQQEELVRAVLSSLSSHVAVLDRQGLVIASNQVWGALAPGLPELPGLALNDCLGRLEAGSAEHQTAARGVRAVLAGELPRFTLERRLAGFGTRLRCAGS